jgi:hypothetical protein
MRLKNNVKTEKKIVRFPQFTDSLHCCVTLIFFERERVLRENKVFFFAKSFFKQFRSEIWKLKIWISKKTNIARKHEKRESALLCTEFELTVFFASKGSRSF